MKNETTSRNAKQPSEESLKLARQIYEAGEYTGNNDSLDVISAAHLIDEFASQSNLTEPTTSEKESQLPTDKEVAEWFDLNIDGDSASSAIYKFRLWLKDRKGFESEVTDEEIIKESNCYPIAGGDDDRTRRGGLVSGFIEGAKWMRDLPKSRESEWISVEDKLPGLDHYVLWYREDGSIRMECIHKDGSFEDVQGSTKWGKITHWQEITHPKTQ